MVKEAESNREADQKRKNVVNARNTLDGLVYTLEKTIKDNAEKVKAEDKQAVEAAIVEAKKALESNDEATITAATEKLTQASNKMAEELYKQKASKEEIENKKLTLIEGDVLELEMSKVIFKTYKIIANIPYNITGAILKKFLTEEIQPELMVLLVQKEVADRIIARDHKESLLSLSVIVYGVPTYIMKVGARYFSPAPKVDSAVIKINKISRDFFSKNEINESLFWELARAGFAHKRKILAGNLKSWRTGVDWQKLLADSGVSKNARAEDLILDNWISVLKHLE
jgi:16S rRNA (adenine1518-N6/adenine1519-N6)-dimethyltransferase